MMNNRQIEIAAREYCRLSNMDPDEKVEQQPPPIGNGTKEGAPVYWPRWKAVAERISQIDIIQHCMEIGKASTGTAPEASPTLPSEAVSARIQRIFSWFPEQPKPVSGTTEPG